MPASPHAAVLRARVHAEAPAAPGVYSLAGTDGQTLYVGKSVNLRRRLLDYFPSNDVHLESHIRPMAFATRSFSFRETATELLALLLEDALIKEIDPPYNTRQREYREYCYLAQSRDRFAAFTVVGNPDPGGKSYGPFRDRFVAHDVREFIARRFGLRSCTDARPYRHSARFDLGQCPGPCRDAISAASYARRVERAEAFLHGDDRWLSRELSTEMERSAKRLDFEAASALRDDLHFATRFASRQRFGAGFASGSCEIVDSEAGLSYRFIRGALIQIEATNSSASPPEIPRQLVTEPLDAAHMFDRAGIVAAWVARRAATRSVRADRPPAVSSAGSATPGGTGHAHDRPQSRDTGGSASHRARSTTPSRARPRQAEPGDDTRAEPG